MIEKLKEIVNKGYIICFLPYESVENGAIKIQIYDSNETSLKTKAAYILRNSDLMFTDDADSLLISVIEKQLIPMLHTEQRKEKIKHDQT